MTPRDIALEIVVREDGYVDDPDDPGGPTKWGVTIHTMKRLMMDLDQDGDVDDDDVRALTKEQAADVFLQHYFHRPRIDWLPEQLHDTVFDMQVNAGSAAVKLLQDLLNDFGADVAVDGGIGQQTARAAEALDAQGAPLRDGYAIARRKRYFAIAEKRPRSRKYCLTRRRTKGGWITRAEEFMSPEYHMTASEFADRVRHWETPS